MRIDDRVRAIVDEELSRSRQSLRAGLHICPNHSKHISVISYGGTTFTHAGLAFEVCCAPQKCKNHQKPLLPDEYVCARYDIWRRIAALEPPPNGKLALGGEAIIMRENLREELEGADNNPFLSNPTRRPPRHFSDTLSSPASTTSRYSNGVLSRSSSTAATIPSTRRGVLGRPPNTMCDVIAYVYVEGRHNPLMIKATGTLRDEVVEFRFGQAAIYEALGLDPTDPLKSVYTIWHQTAKTWTTHPKCSHAIFLALGERVLYREQYVFNTPNLEHYLAILLPPETGEDTRPLIPGLSPFHNPLKRFKEGNTLDHDTPSKFSLLHQLPFAAANEPGPSNPRKRSPSPMSRTRKLKRRRQADPLSSPIIDLTTDHAESSSAALSKGVSQRKARGRDKRSRGEADVLVVSD